MSTTSDTPILYASPLSGFSYKPALAMGLMRLDYELRIVDLTVPRTERRADFRAVARFGEVPVLLVDGLAIAQSNVILEYLARRESRLHEGDESQRIRVREWLAWEANRIGLNLAHAGAARTRGGYVPQVQAWYETRSEADLDHLERVLERGGFLVGDAVTIADVACVAYLLWPGHAPDLARWPNVKAWIGRIEALDGFRSPAQVFVDLGAER
ncbi:glutathione S-transferase family protein [Chiayiivirga flava]|uniref:Glutathione S-transferase n=1 Tax=Chiayiivirga flava TaxID=659595 RepID=A0A7W8FZW2_9GAMM|nr:glutathione S-transferase family protein [Chiayiivirga flava]MBB5208551.1 glutathione S-transferase [Chiayiivirga flava]